LFNKEGIPVCPACQPDEEADFEAVRTSLQETPNQTAEQVAELTGVDEECVLRLLSAGRIANVTPSKAVTCGRCGAPAISFTKRLCEKCLAEMNVELAAAQSKIQLPPRKQVSDSAARSVKDVVDQKRKF
jgi:NMD protein affecting ribosome stability and mRNA decay